jgi:hypothetical protein
MWIFTKHGFFSAVCARQGKGAHGQPVDLDRIMIRGRLHSHLRALKERFSDLLGQCEIHERAGTDYAFRMFVQKSVWVQVLAALAQETDYDNFKSEVAQHQGFAGAAYDHLLHEVWSVMHKLQEYKRTPAVASRHAGDTHFAPLPFNGADKNRASRHDGVFP